jgi:hypothetical protein
MKDYAELAAATPEVAKQVRDDFFPELPLDPEDIHCFDSLMAEAVTLK